jgi:hypothetical protein
MKQRSLVLLGVFLIVIVGAVSTSAVLFTKVYATIEGNIPIVGRSTYNIRLWDSHNTSNNITLSSSGTKLPLPWNITNINDGWIVRAMYYIRNCDTITHYVKISINNSWFNVSSHPWYGFIYGLGGHGNDSDLPIIIKQDFTLSPNVNNVFYVWFKVKSNMLTPPGGYVHPTILVETVR